MEVIFLGPIVLQRRIDLGLPLEIVCEGICTPMTLSRFEKGQQTPSRDCVVAILQRLGLPDDRYYAQLTRREIKLRLLRKEALAYYKCFEHTLGEEQQQARSEALKTLNKMERYIKKNDRLNRQFILGIKSALEEHSPQKQLEMLMQAIHLTSPRFDLNKIDCHLYCVSEVVIISRIAISLAGCGLREKAIDIYAQLLDLLLERNPDHNRLPLITYNYALQLGLAGRFEESLQISEFGQKACVKQGHYDYLPKFLHVKAECCYLMGEIDKSLELYHAAYYIYEVTMDTKNQEALKADVKERFGLIF